MLLRRFLTCAVFFVALLAAGCSSLPVQELSDARLTIRSAYDAGAATYAMESLSEAEVLFQRASRLVEENRYGKAKATAIQARERASSAREIAILRSSESKN